MPRNALIYYSTTCQAKSIDNLNLFECFLYLSFKASCTITLFRYKIPFMAYLWQELTVNRSSLFTSRYTDSMIFFFSGYDIFPWIINHLCIFLLLISRDDPCIRTIAGNCNQNILSGLMISQPFPYQCFQMFFITFRILTMLLTRDLNIAPIVCFLFTS